MRRARSSSVRSERNTGVPSPRTASARSSAATSPASDLSPLRARRCLARRCSTDPRSASTRSSSSSPSWSAGSSPSPAAQHDQQRVAVTDVAEQAAAEPLAGTAPGGEAGDVLELERGVDAPLRLRHLGEQVDALVGQLGHALGRVEAGGRLEPGQRAVQLTVAGVRSSDESESLRHPFRVPTRGRAPSVDYRGAPHVEEDEEAEAARPPQQGEPRQAPERREPVLAGPESWRIRALIRCASDLRRPFGRCASGSRWYGRQSYQGVSTSASRLA